MALPGVLPAAGIPHSEREAKKASVIQQLSPPEIEGLRVACRVRKEEFPCNYYSLLMVNYL